MPTIRKPRPAHSDSAEFPSSPAKGHQSPSDSDIMTGAPLAAEADDILTAPPPEPQVLAHLHPAPLALGALGNARAVARRVSFGSKSIAFKQTLIPILLTLAALSLLTAAAEWIVPPESPIAPPVPWAPWALLGLGALFLAIAVLNILMLRSELAAAS